MLLKNRILGCVSNDVALCFLSNSSMKYLRIIVIAFLIWTIGGVVLFRFVPVPFTPMMLRYCMGEIFDGKWPSFTHDWVAMEKIDPNLKYAVIASEDQRFYEHNGFDFKAIEEAMEERRTGKRKRGASTITQQTAKNLFTFGTSTWVRKGIEAYYTVLIELLWSKERILEVYLNSIEMGRGIYGAEAVAQEHFNCSADKLRRSDCALIAATLPNPKKFSSKNPSPYMLKRRKQILRQMRLMGK